MIKKLFLSLFLALSLLCIPAWAGIDFDGVDDFVNFTYSSDFDFDVDDFSISFWMKTTSTAGGFPTLLARGGGNNIWGAYLTNSSVDIFFFAYGQGGPNKSVTSSGATVNDGSWHNIIVVRNSTTLKIYIDNVERGSGSSWSLAINQTSNEFLRMGYDGNNGQYDGLINEAALWKGTALNISDRGNLYNSKVKRMPFQIQAGNLVSYWPTDDGPDGTGADSDNVGDYSGNGNDGTGDDGANNTGLTWMAEEVLTYQ